MPAKKKTRSRAARKNDAGQLPKKKSPPAKPARTKPSPSAGALASDSGAASAHPTNNKPPNNKPPKETRVVEAEFVGALGTSGGSLPQPTFVEVAFAGRSNVGKSSLINTLLERRNLVRVSSTPGCTRQINMFKVRTADETTLHLVDLPGYGFARRSKSERASWAKLIGGYLADRPTLTTLILLIDVRRGLESDDMELIELVKHAESGVSRRPVEVVLVATKLDKLPKSKQRLGMSNLQKTVGLPVLGFSSITREGREPLWRAMRKAALGAS